MIVVALCTIQACFICMLTRFQSDLRVENFDIVNLSKAGHVQGNRLLLSILNFACCTLQKF